jgi:hypothetical protein
MEKRSVKLDPPKPTDLRQDRLKAALKANMQKRKAQVRARKNTDKEKG